MRRALAARGLIELIADARSGRLLGAHILAPEGADSIQTAMLAIRQRLTVNDLSDTIFPYLTNGGGVEACRTRLCQGRGEVVVLRWLR